jgi:hypothetical protein
MIYESGKIAPSPKERKENKLKGDESFSRLCSETFGKNLPNFEKRELDFNSMILLACKNVEPHRDPLVVDKITGLRRAALFWLTEGRVHLQCGDDFIRMSSGDYVIFDDSIAHCVVADRKWRGAAAQFI